MVLPSTRMALGAAIDVVSANGVAQLGSLRLSLYRFLHSLFQQYLYDRLSAGERRLLHGEVGQALEGLYVDRTEDVVGQLAHHFAAALARAFLPRAKEKGRPRGNRHHDD